MASKWTELNWSPILQQEPQAIKPSKFSEYFVFLLQRFSTLDQNDEINLLHKHQWHTRWAFAQKRDIFTCENITFTMTIHNKSHHSHQKTIKVKWFGISLVFI